MVVETPLSPQKRHELERSSWESNREIWEEAKRPVERSCQG